MVPHDGTPTPRGDEKEETTDYTDFFVFFFVFLCVTSWLKTKDENKG